MHDDFSSFLRKSEIDSETVNAISTKITDVNDEYVEYRVYFDFGDIGRSQKDVWVIVDFVRTSGVFRFVQIDHPTRN